METDATAAYITQIGQAPPTLAETLALTGPPYFSHAMSAIALSDGPHNEMIWNTRHSAVPRYEAIIVVLQRLLGTAHPGDVIRLNPAYVESLDALVVFRGGEDASRIAGIINPMTGRVAQVQRGSDGGAVMKIESEDQS